MQAIRFHPPGGPENLRLEREPIPGHLEPTHVLIKVHGVGVTWPELSWPAYQRRNGTYVPHIPGHDFSGTVVRTGWGVDGDGNEDGEIVPGAEVYAFTTGRTEEGLRQFEGAMAEYAVADRTEVVLKPRNLVLTEAASVPLSALTAWQALHDHGQLRIGQRLLITGAAGATGLWAVQIARLIGAHVIGTASSAESFEMLRELGVDQIVDYKTQRLEESVADVDLVLDTVGAKVLEQCAKVVKKEGLVLSIADFGAAARIKPARGKFFIVAMNKGQLREITELVEEGKLKTFVDTVMPMRDAAEAFRKGAEGHSHGRIVLVN